MTDNKISLHLDFTEQHPDIPSMAEAKLCPEHHDVPPEINYGLAGGGIGVYMICPVCGRILGKDQDDD